MAKPAPRVSIIQVPKKPEPSDAQRVKNEAERKLAEKLKQLEFKKKAKTVSPTKLAGLATKISSMGPKMDLTQPSKKAPQQ